MPIYEYQCPQCQAVFEEWLTVSDAISKNTAPCPHCTTVSPHIISNTAFVLKGGGWYVTEYGSRKDSAAETPAVSAEHTPSEKAHGEDAQHQSDGNAHLQKHKDTPHNGEKTQQKNTDTHKSLASENNSAPPKPSPAVSAQSKPANKTRAEAS